MGHPPLILMQIIFLRMDIGDTNVILGGAEVTHVYQSAGI